MAVTDNSIHAIAQAIDRHQPLGDDVRIRSEALAHAERFVASVNSARSFGHKVAGPPLELLRARDVLNVAVVFHAYLFAGELPALDAD